MTVGRPFQPGQSGNPLGRAPGSRNKLCEDFLKTLQEDFAAHGASAVVACREEQPGIYLKVIAGLLPKEMTLKLDSPLNDLTDDDLTAAVIALRSALAAQAGSRVAQANGSQEPNSVH